MEKQRESEELLYLSLKEERVFEREKSARESRNERRDIEGRREGES